MEELLEEQKQIKKYSKLQWFFVVIFIPTIFAIVVGAIVASVAGFDVFGKTKELAEKLPFISSTEEKTENQIITNLEKQLTELTTEIQEKESTISQLENEVHEKEQEIQSIKLKKDQLEMQLEEVLNVQEEESVAFKEIVRTFENISAKKAAPIITAMNDEEAINILSSLKSDTLASLLEKMKAEDAAKYTSVLMIEKDSEANE